MTVCARCNTDAYDGAKKCPNCDYSPQRDMQLTGFLLIILGGMLSVAVVGIPIGVYGAYMVLDNRDIDIDSEAALD